MIALAQQVVTGCLVFAVWTALLVVALCFIDFSSSPDESLDPPHRHPPHLGR